MIEICPKIEEKLNCPICNNELKINKAIIPGMRILADTHCKKCDKNFYTDLPIGHGIDFGVSIDKKNGNIHGHKTFYSKLLTKTLQSKKNILFKEIKNEKKNNELLILNCLDTCYGHSLLKLINADHYIKNHKDKDLLIIIPKFLSWMVPEKTERIIEVDIPLKDGYLWINELNEELLKIFNNYAKVYISKTFSHPHPNNFNISTFIPRHKPFDINNLGNKNNPLITFIAREDITGNRLWIRVGFFYKLLIRLRKNHKNITLLNKLANYYQRLSIIKLYKYIKLYLPNLDFAVVGHGKTGKFPKVIKDMRAKNIDKKTELKWCKRYSESNLIIGVHGSHLLLPSAFAGATIEFIDHNDKLRNIYQDVLINEKDVRLALFRYRVLPIKTSVKSTAKACKSVITEYDQYYKNMIKNTHKNT